MIYVMKENLLVIELSKIKYRSIFQKDELPFKNMPISAYVYEKYILVYETYHILGRYILLKFVIEKF